jgi:hypothetical protein
MVSGLGVVVGVDNPVLSDAEEDAEGDEGGDKDGKGVVMLAFVFVW